MAVQSNTAELRVRPQLSYLAYPHRGWVSAVDAGSVAMRKKPELSQTASRSRPREPFAVVYVLH